jgi:DNA repair exonuclease SbcCD ATPase subunit
MITLKRLVLHNLFGVKHVEVNLDNQGLVIVQGENGSGKSSIFMEGILYMLYGQSFVYGKSPGASVVNRFGDGGGYGTITLDADGTLYTIARARNHKPYRTGVSLYQGDLLGGKCDDITPVKTPQDAVTKLLGMPARTFMMSVMFPATITRFPSMGDTERKAVLDDLLETTALDGAFEITKGKCILLEERLRQAGARLGNVETSRSTLEAEEEQAEEAAAGWHDSHSAEVGASMAKIRELKDDLEGLGEALVAAREAEVADREAWSSSASGLSAAAPGLADEAEAIWGIKMRVDGDIKTARRSVTVGERARDKAQALIDSGKCPTCGEDTSHATDPHRVVLEQTESLNGLQTELENAQEELDELGRRMELHEAAKAVQAKVEAEAAKLERTASQAARITNDIELEMAQSKSRLKTLIEHTRAKAGETNPHGGSVERIQCEIRALADRYTTLKGEVGEVRSELDEEEILRGVFGPKGARLAMIERAIPMLNGEAARLAEVMGTDIRVKFALRGEGESFANTLQIDVDNPQGAAIYRGQSQGEKRRADLLILLALLQLAISRGRRSFRQVFFDEAFESVDKRGEEAVMQVMRDISTHCTSVFTLNHNADHISSMADRVWTVRDGTLEC